MLRGKQAASRLNRAKETRTKGPGPAAARLQPRKLSKQLKVALDTEKAKDALGQNWHRWKRTKCASQVEYQRALQPRLWPSRKTADDIHHCPWTGRLIIRGERPGTFFYDDNGRAAHWTDAYAAGFQPTKERENT